MSKLKGTLSYFPGLILNLLFASFLSSSEFLLILLRSVASQGFLPRGPAPPKLLTLRACSQESVFSQVCLKEYPSQHCPPPPGAVPGYKFLPTGFSPLWFLSYGVKTLSWLFLYLFPLLPCSPFLIGIIQSCSPQLKQSLNYLSPPLGATEWVWTTTLVLFFWVI